MKPRLRGQLLAVYFLFNIVPISGAHAGVLADCWKALSSLTSKPAILSLPAITDLELSAESRQIIDRHEIQQLKKYFSKNDLTFYHAKMDGSGESVQMHYITRVLKHIFPHAKFSKAEYETDGVDENNFVNRLFLPIGDSAEFGDKLERQSRLEMSLVKAGNPLYSSIEKDKTRRILGIHPNARVLHVYSSVYFGQRDAHFINDGKLGNILRTLKLVEPKFDIIILSISGASSVGEIWNEEMEGQPKDWRRITEMFVGDFAKLSPGQSKPVLIYNNSKGKMPFLHAVADLSVVRGPINFFEPLSVGVPTIVIHNEMIHSYDPNVFTGMVRTAERADNFVLIPTENNILHAEQLLRQRVKGRLHSVEPFKEALDHLHEVLNHLISRKKAGKTFFDPF
jgi:hypothetical protein